MVAKQTGAIGTEVGQKISAKSLGFDKKTVQRLVLANEGVDVFLYRVIGDVIGLQEYKSTFDDRDEEEQGFGLVGSFDITTNTGEVTEGEGVLYLSGPMHKHAVAAMQSSENGYKLRMAVDVYARESERSGTGYTFINRSLIEPDRSGIEELKKQIGNTPLPQLPAPKA